MKVLIADDEKKICTLIKNLIDWDGNGLELVGVANNGIAAYEMALNLEPDIVITDIKMPGMDGIGLIESLMNRNLKAEFIIISGYKQFEYAHSAMKYGIQSYLLKPIDQNELQKAIEKAILHVQEKKGANKNAQRKKLKQNFIDNMIHRQERLFMGLEQINQRYELDFRDGVFQALFLRVDSLEDGMLQMDHIHGLLVNEIEQLLIETSSEYIVNNTGEGILTVINFSLVLSERHPDFLPKVFQRLKYVTEKFSNLQLTLGVGQTVSAIEDIYLSINSSMDAVRLRSFEGADRIINMNDLSYLQKDLTLKGIEMLGQNLSLSMERLDWSGTKESIDKCLFVNEQIIRDCPILFFRVLLTIEDIIVKKLKEMSVDEAIIAILHKELNTITINYASRPAIIHHYKKRLEMLLEKVEVQKTEQERLPVIEAKRYIQELYPTGVSLEEIADKIGLSSAYLSTLFKNETGTKFSDYLMEIRMNQAKKLLKNTNLSMVEIAEAIGYKDTKYFSRAFKKTVGIKPSMFRKLYRGGE